MSSYNPYYTNFVPILLLVHFCESEGPSALFCTQAVDKNKFNQQATDLETNLESMFLLPVLKPDLNAEIEKMENVVLQDTEFVSVEECGRFYLSSHHLKPVYTSQFKSLSLRTLSVEYVGPGREGPVLFGDEENGYNFAYVFKIKDSKARGFARWYSFVLLDPSLSCLTLSWGFLQMYENI